MSSIRGERRDVMPLTWELPAAAGLTWAGVAGLLLPAGRGAACWLTGAGWIWPGSGAAAAASVVGLLSGHPGAGLTRAAASALPGPGAVYLLLAVAEAAWLIISLAALLTWWHTWGPGVHQGLASRGEVEKVLGRSRLWRNRSVIRPDLYARAPQSAGHR